METDIKEEQLCDVIKNLRLFTNTEKEWKEKYASLYKPGQKGKLLMLLDAQCKKRYDGLDLFDLMKDYEMSSKKGFIDKHKRDVIFTDEDNLLSIVRHSCMSEDAPLPKNLEGKRNVKGFLECDPALLLLWFIVNHERHIKALPFFDERQGDVDLSTYSYFIGELRRILPKIFPAKAFVDDTPPIIISEFRKINVRLRNHTIIRMDLVSLVINVLSSVIVLNNKDELYYVTKEVTSHHSISLDICDGEALWINPDEAPLNYIYRFEEGCNSYSLVRYDLNAHCFSDYTVIFYRQEDVSYAVILSPTSVLSLVKNEPLADGTFIYCNYEIDFKGDKPDVLRLHPYSGHISSFPCSLKRINEKALTKLFPVFNIEELVLYENEYQDYEYERRNVERLISADYIFVEKSSIKQEDGSSKVTSWYRIPRYGNNEWNLDQIQPEDFIFHIHIFGEDYLFFDMLNLSLKVTTEQDCTWQYIEVMAVPSYEF